LRVRIAAEAAANIWWNFIVVLLCGVSESAGGGKGEIQGSLHCGGKSAAFGRDDVLLGLLVEKTCRWLLLALWKDVDIFSAGI
jgi:hypothetical protein